MKQISFIALLFIVIFSSCEGEKKEKSADIDTVTVKKDSIQAGPALELVWETDTTLTTCESVLHVPAQNTVYVSCINGDPSRKDGNGFISKISPEGKVQDLKWSKGKLNAPKGMGVLDNSLFVTDIDEFVRIDLNSGKILKKIKVPGSVFLNDITVDAKGKTVYFSDSEASVIYRYRNDSVQVFMKDTIQAPNGLLYMGDKMFVASFKGDFKVIDMNSRKVTHLGSGIGGGDGVVYSGKNNQFIVSNWYGEVFAIKPEGQVTKILDLKDQKLNTADIDYIEDKKLVLIPVFFGNRVMAYEVKW
jgi:DNA-binding beta-propeller fold protein YncE